MSGREIASGVGGGGGGGVYRVFAGEMECILCVGGGGGGVCIKSQACGFLPKWRRSCSKKLLFCWFFFSQLYQKTQLTIWQSPWRPAVQLTRTLSTLTKRLVLSFHVFFRLFLWYFLEILLCVSPYLRLAFKISCNSLWLHWKDQIPATNSCFSSCPIQSQPSNYKNEASPFGELSLCRFIIRELALFLETKVDQRTSESS